MLTNVCLLVISNLTDVLLTYICFHLAAIVGMMKFHLGVVLFFTFRLVVIAQPQCFDVPGWEDTDGDDCKW